MNILFSEDEWYYRDLGLVDMEGMSYTFGGMRLYKKARSRLEKFDMFVCAYYTMPHNVLLTERFQCEGIKTVLCSDGIFDFSNAFHNIMHRKYGLVQFHPVLQDYFICVGKIEAEYFSSEEIVAMDYMPKRMISELDPLPFPVEDRVLVTTANTAYFNDEEYGRLLKLMSGIIHQLRIKRIEFSVRIFDERLLRDLSIGFGDQLTNDLKGGFEETLSRYSSVITTPSSIAVVSMFHRRPTALLIYRDSPMFLQSGWLIPSEEVFLSLLSSFLSKDKGRMEIQSRLFENYSAEHGLTERILEVSKMESQKATVYSDYIGKSYRNMLESKFNFNIEWYVRRLYRSLKGSKFLSRFLSRLKLSIF
jgi:hypothetical protein